MDNRYGLMRQSSEVWRSLTDGDFEEEDVWSILKDRTTTTDHHHHRSFGDKSSKDSPCLSVPRRVASAARMIPKVTRGGGCDSSSSSVNSSHEAKIVQHSAPVNIPNWPIEIRKQKSNNIKDSENHDSWHDHDDYDHDDDGDYDDDDDDDGDGDDDDNDDYDCKVPPHEFIARRLAKSRISTFSVFEGVGRTLKGRDLSKVRNAILTKTGFLESL